jgi:hypothetical protein
VKVFRSFSKSIIEETFDEKPPNATESQQTGPVDVNGNKRLYFKSQALYIRSMIGVGLVNATVRIFPLFKT